MPNPQFGEAEYLCYQVIKQVREQHGEGHDLPETTYNKLCYIADKELRETGIDIELPVHWYRYGGVLTDDAMSDGFCELASTKWQNNRGNNVVLANGVDDGDFAVRGDRAAAIDEKVEELVRDIGGHYGISIPQDYQYEEYAPNDFVRTLHAFRKFLDDLDTEDALAAEEYVGGVDTSFSDILAQPSTPKSSEQTSSDNTDSEVRDYLDDLITTYPEEEYERMEGLFLEWENLMWQMAQNGFYSRLQDFMEAFWTAFSRVELRVKHNRNVPLRIRSKWNNEISDEMQSFRDEVEEYREVVLENRDETETLDTVAESYSETVRDMFDQPTQ
jgi:hypothetical protein